MLNKIYVFIIFISLFAIKIASAQYDLEVAFPHLNFTRPVDLQNAGDGSDRIFVVEQTGLIYILKNDSSTVGMNVFLDIQDLVTYNGSEQGLLGLAFHPDFTENGYFYVNYTATNPNRTVVARFNLSPNDPTIADKSSELVIMEFDQPETNHNGGQLAFGPDGYLYIATGDGGGGGDMHGEIGNGQDLTVLLGKILRIDVDKTDGELNYAIPQDNPFFGNQFNYRQEIFAYGLRNPWRFSFDPETKMLWAGDVGQGSYEEVDIIESGNNYGWRIMEGLHCYNPSSGCDQTGLTLPIWEYSHDIGYSITGGYVYRGPGVPELNGRYIYADYGTRWIWSLTYDGKNPAINDTISRSPYAVSSFGVDEKNELYICTFNGDNSQIYRLVPTVTSTVAGMKNTPPVDFYLGENHPNPFNPGTTIPFRLNKQADVQISIFDVNGKLINTLLNEHKLSGRYTVYWNGYNAQGYPQTSGMYFYRMKVNGKIISSRRLVLLK